MAKRQVVSYSYTCDVCGDTIPDSEGDSATRKLSWEGTDYVVDVCSTHAAELSDVLIQLKGYVDAGHRGTVRRGRRPSAVAAATAAPRAPRGRRESTAAATSPSAPKRGDLGAIRAWARENGHKVSERGRIPGSLLTAYDEANSAPAPAPAAAPAPVAAARKRRPRKAAAAAAS
jgi:hypothetical protein